MRHSLAYGDVVVAAGGTITTTTTPQDPRPVGVVQRATGDAFDAPIVFSGYVARINTAGTVAAGDYLQTSDTAGKAEAAGGTSGAGTVVLVLADGPNPPAILIPHA